MIFSSPHGRRKEMTKEAKGRNSRGFEERNTRRSGQTRSVLLLLQRRRGVLLLRYSSWGEDDLWCSCSVLHAKNTGRWDCVCELLVLPMRLYVSRLFCRWDCVCELPVLRNYILSASSREKEMRRHKNSAKLVVWSRTWSMHRSSSRLSFL